MARQAIAEGTAVLVSARYAGKERNSYRDEVVIGALLTPLPDRASVIPLDTLKRALWGLYDHLLAGTFYDDYDRASEQMGTLRCFLDQLGVR